MPRQTPYFPIDKPLPPGYNHPCSRKRGGIAGLCKGSTADSDSVCEGSNPSPAAKNRPPPFGGGRFFCPKDSNPHNAIPSGSGPKGRERVGHPGSLSPAGRAQILLPLPYFGLNRFDSGRFFILSAMFFLHLLWPFVFDHFFDHYQDVTPNLQCHERIAPSGWHLPPSWYRRRDRKRPE